MRTQGASQKVEDYLDNARRAMDPKRNMLYLQAGDAFEKEDLRFMEQYLETFSMAGTLKEEVAREFFLQFEAEEWMGDALWPHRTSNVENPVFRRAGWSKSTGFIRARGGGQELLLRAASRTTLERRDTGQEQKRQRGLGLSEFYSWQQQWPEDPSIISHAPARWRS